jgi:hypothetical protein
MYSTLVGQGHMKLDALHFPQKPGILKGGLGGRLRARDLGTHAW